MRLFGVLVLLVGMIGALAAPGCWGKPAPQGAVASAGDSLAPPGAADPGEADDIGWSAYF